MHENLRERAHKTSEKTTDRQQMTSLIVKIAKGYFGSKNKKKRKRKRCHTDDSSSSNSQSSSSNEIVVNDNDTIVCGGRHIYFSD